MENKNSCAYRVFVQDTEISGSRICLYEAATIDEACAFGLMIHRSANVSTLEVCVYNFATDVDMVVFSKTAKVH